MLFFYVSKFIFFNQLLKYKLTIDQMHDGIILSNKFSLKLQSVKFIDSYCVSKTQRHMIDKWLPNC